MEHRRVRARSHDTSVRRAIGSLATKRLEQERFDFVFVHPCMRLGHRADVRFFCDLRRRSHRVEILGRLDQTHLVNDRTWVEHFGRPHDPMTSTRARLVDRRENFVVKRSIASKPKIKPFRVLHQRRQMFFELVDRVRLIGAVLRLYAVDTRTRSVPNLTLRIARSHEHRRLRSTKHENAVRLVEPGQIEEIRVLPVIVIDVIVANVNRRRRENPDRIIAALAHRFCEGCTATGVELLRVVARERHTNVFPTSGVAVKGETLIVIRDRERSESQCDRQ
jgi:hypothetical protein